jgi:hypothetical protein
MMLPTAWTAVNFAICRRQADDLVSAKLSFDHSFRNLRDFACCFKFAIARATVTNAWFKRPCPGSKREIRFNVTNDCSLRNNDRPRRASSFVRTEGGPMCGPN